MFMIYIMILLKNIINQLDKFAAFFDDSHEKKYDCEIDPLFDDEVAPEPIRP